MPSFLFFPETGELKDALSVTDVQTHPLRPGLPGSFHALFPSSHREFNSTFLSLTRQVFLSFALIFIKTTFLSTLMFPQFLYHLIKPINDNNKHNCHQVWEQTQLILDKHIL